MEPYVSRPPGAREILVELRLRVLALDQCLAELSCPECGQAMTLHQPDEGRPYQLLGTCDGCDRWFILRDLSDVGREFAIYEVPCPSLMDRLPLDRGARPQSQVS